MQLANHNALTLRQTSFWRGWRYDLLDEGGQLLGNLEWPMWSQAKNARLRFTADQDAVAVLMRLRGVTFRICFEYTKRAWNNDIRWTLESGDGQVLSCLEQRYVPEQKLRRPKLLLTQPFAAELIPLSGSWGNIHMVLRRSNEMPVVTVRTPHLFSLKRELLVEGSGISDELKAFLGFLALNFFTS